MPSSSCRRMEEEGVRGSEEEEEEDQMREEIEDIVVALLDGKYLFHQVVKEDGWTGRRGFRRWLWRSCSYWGVGKKMRQRC